MELRDKTGGLQQYAALVGIDWGDKKHAWSMEDDSGNRKKGKLEQAPEAVEVWVSELMQRHPGQLIAVAVEQSRGALVAMLHKYEGLHVYPVHPTMSARYRQMLHPSGAKNDDRDGQDLLDLLKKHAEQLTRLELDTVETRQLQQLVEQRRRMVDEVTRFTNRITAQLKVHYPQMLIWWPDLNTEVAAQWLEKWPTLQQVKQAKPAEVKNFLRQHRYGDDYVQQRMTAIQQAVPALEDRAILEPATLIVKAWVGVVRVMKQHIAIQEKEIKRLYEQHPDYAIIDSLPGAGQAMGPRLVAALGTKRERFASASELHNQSGISPVTRQSGNTSLVQMRRACPNFVRQTFHEWASHSVNHSEWAGHYYRQQRQKGKHHHAALRALAYKWQRILFRCWKDGVVYDESRYQRARAEHAIKQLPKAKTL